MPTKGIYLKVPEETLEDWKHEAESHAMSLSAWIRECCNHPLEHTVIKPVSRRKSDRQTAQASNEVLNVLKREQPVHFEDRPHDKTCQCQVCQFRRKVLKDGQ